MEWIAANVGEKEARAVRAAGTASTQELHQQIQMLEARAEAQGTELQAQGKELTEIKRQLDNALAKTRDHRSSGTPPKARRSSTPPPRKRP